MRGAHRGPGGASAGKNARWLAVLALLVIGPIAVIAGLIWFFTTATSLELSAAVLILAVAGLVKALVEDKLDMIWVSASTVVAFGWEVISDVTHQPGGSLVEYVIRTVAFACATIGLIRAGGLGWVGRVIRDRLAPGSFDDGAG